MAAVLAFAVDAGHLALHPERRPAVMKVHATDRLVERAVAVVVLAAFDVARRRRDSLAFLCGEQEGDNRMELGRERIKIVCYPHDGKGGPKVASAYIELA